MLREVSHAVASRSEIRPAPEGVLRERWSQLSACGPPDVYWHKRSLHAGGMRAFPGVPIEDMATLLDRVQRGQANPAERAHHTGEGTTEGI
jgi:hypothetical protein